LEFIDAAARFPHSLAGMLGMEQIGVTGFDATLDRQRGLANGTPFDPGSRSARS
jgi:hypothetical protein